MGKIIENRKELYKALLKTTTGNRVLSRDGKDVGIIRNYATLPYIGEAGYSSRYSVLWKDGRTTLCAVKGMKQIKGGYQIL